jgi:hypothetical protein
MLNIKNSIPFSDLALAIRFSLLHPSDRLKSHLRPLAKSKSKLKPENFLLSSLYGGIAILRPFTKISYTISAGKKVIFRDAQNYPQRYEIKDVKNKA